MLLTRSIKFLYIVSILILYVHATTQGDISWKDFTISQTLCSVDKDKKLKSFVLTLVGISVILQLIYGLVIFKEHKIVSIVYIVFVCTFAYSLIQVIDSNCNLDPEQVSKHYRYAGLLILTMFFQCCLVSDTSFSITFGISIIAWLVYMSKSIENLTVISIFELLFFIQYVLC